MTGNPESSRARSPVVGSAEVNCWGSSGVTADSGPYLLTFYSNFNSRRERGQACLSLTWNRKVGIPSMSGKRSLSNSAIYRSSTVQAYRTENWLNRPALEGCNSTCLVVSESVSRFSIYQVVIEGTGYPFDSGRPNL